MRVVGITLGLLFIAVGITAVVGADTADAMPWFFAFAIVAMGIGGLIGALRSKSSAV